MNKLCEPRQSAAKPKKDSAAFAAKYELTRREEEIAYYMSQSKSNGEIAGILQLSESTVRFHVSNILKKAGSSDRNEVSRKYHMG